MTGLTSQASAATMAADASGQQMHAMGGLQTTSTGASGGNNSNAGASAGTDGGLETDVEVSGATVANVDSHLDSFFQTHSVTREDVMVLAAAVQLVMWVALLYVEVSQR